MRSDRAVPVDDKEVVMRCDQVADSLAQAADGSSLLDPPARAHVEQCLRCQAELVQYRKLLRALRDLRTEVLEPSPGLLTDVLAAISEDSERRSVRHLLGGRRVAYLGGIAAAATAAGVGSAIVIATRSRRRGAFPLAS